MQSIYDGIGNLNAYKGESPDTVKEIKKSKNRRNPKVVIDLANRLRTDGIVQIPSIDLGAPNMSAGGYVESGTIKFIYSSDPDVVQVRTYLTTTLGWDFSNAKETKEVDPIVWTKKRRI
jgi:DNA helicase-2/ATP-dependent DNA helicase PcrA